MKRFGLLAALWVLAVGAWAQGSLSPDVIVKGAGAVYHDKNVAKFELYAEKRAGAVKGNMALYDFSATPVGTTFGVTKVTMDMAVSLSLSGNVATIGGIGTLNGEPAKLEIVAVDVGISPSVTITDTLKVTAWSATGKTFVLKGPVRPGDIAILRMNSMPGHSVTGKGIIPVVNNPANTAAGAFAIDVAFLPTGSNTGKLHGYFSFVVVSNTVATKPINVQSVAITKLLVNGHNAAVSGNVLFNGIKGVANVYCTDGGTAGSPVPDTFAIEVYVNGQVVFAAKGIVKPGDIVVK